jgi:hypothetical protein
MEPEKETGIVRRYYSREMICFGWHAAVIKYRKTIAGGNKTFNR